MVTTTTGIATSFIQFSRASLATVTNNVGNIAWAGHNLLTNSESFDAASWIKTTGITTITANQTVAPNGSTTADIFNEGTGAGYRLAEQGVSTIASVTYTVGFYAKYISCQWVSLSLYSNSSATSYGAATFDLLNGVVGTSAAAGTGYAIVGSPVMQAVGGGWYFCSLTVVNGSSLPANYLAIAASNVGTIGNYGLNSYTGTSRTFYLWGAFAYRSDLGGMVYNPAQPAGFGTYYPTTPKNLLGYTEDFSNAAWVKDGVQAFGSGSVSNAVLSPNGLQTADLITENTASSTYHFIYQSVAFINTDTFSVYAKPATGSRFLYLRFLVAINNWATAVFDIASGTVTQQAGGSSWSGARSASITSVGNGWYRCSLTATGTTMVNVAIGLSDSGTRTLDAAGGEPRYTGDGTSGIYIWGAQLSNSASIDPYSPNYGAAPTASAYYAPRLDYSPTTIQPLGMLVEEQRTNLVLNSAAFDVVSWNVASTTITANQVVAPDGTLTADTFAASTTGTFRYVYQAPTLTQNVTYTFSAYFKTKTARWVWLLGETSGDALASFDIQNGVVGAVAAGLTSSITPVGNGWYRCVITFTVTSATGVQQIGFGLSDSNTVINPSATAGIDAYVWGAQLEAGSFPTSYIPTGAATATRSADRATLSLQAFPYSNAEGTWVFNISRNTAGGNNWILGAAGIAGTYDFVAGNTNGNFRYGATGDINGISSNAIGSSGGKIAGAYTLNGTHTISVNGTAVVTTSTSTDPGTPTVFRLGVDGAPNPGTELNGHIRQITYIPRRISNADLQTRTTL